PATHFPIQNLPLGVFRRQGEGAPRIGAAIGERVLDLAACAERGLLRGLPAEVEAACRAATLNVLMAQPARLRGTLRHRLSHLLRTDRGQVTARESASLVLLSRDEIEMLLPCEVGDYSDFYASLFHARNVGSMFRPDNPLLPNYKWVPIGYHGRSSSLVPSGTPVKRPWGQTEPAPQQPPPFGPSRALDYELEVGVLLGPGNPRGTALSLAEAEEHIVGFCLVNDWSARDLQRWEYQPLGPFLSKSFATSLSTWVVTREALAPFRTEAFHRPEGDPEPLPHLRDPDDRAHGGIDLELEVRFASRRMREDGIAPVTVSRSNLKDLYWTTAQMVAHQTSNGCNVRPGDLIASGTVSGPDRSSRGCLLELTWRGQEPIRLPTGEDRRFLEDGDEVILTGRCRKEGFVSIGFGECRGVVV
ncbi:MAG TPA: fumarylacetoacetase, partial [Vicinamibacteria bacterium]